MQSCMCFRQRPAQMKMIALLATAAALVAAPASAAELVFNGGFETGNFAGWTRSGNPGFTGVAQGGAHSGSHAAVFGPVGSSGSITQMLNTVVGQTYNISVWAANGSNTFNFRSLTFGGVVLGSLTNSPAFAYTKFTFSAIATTAQTDLTLTFRNDPAYWHIDDVSVQGAAGTAAVPEPATWGMMLLGFGLVGAAARRRRTLAVA